MKKFLLHMHYTKHRYFLNFGDLLNEPIPEALFPVRVKVEPFDTARVIGLGSILDKLLDNGHLLHQEDIELRDKVLSDKVLGDRPIHVWGTGLMFRYDTKEQKTIRPMIIHALRGELTKGQMSEILGRKLDCILADPGLLVSRLFPAQEKCFDMGIVPHHSDKKDPIVESLKAHYPNSVVIDVQQRPEIVVPQISQCRRIISTSLHGIITADAYNIPNCWCEISDRVEGSGYKFHDYFSSFGTDREPFDLRSGEFPDPQTDFITSFSDYREVEKKQRELIRCFPYSELIRDFGAAIKKKAGTLLK